MDHSNQLETLKGIVLDAVAELLRASGAAAVALRGATPDHAVLAGDVTALARLLDLQADDAKDVAILAAMAGAPPRLWLVKNPSGWTSAFYTNQPDPAQWPGKTIEEYVVTRVNHAPPTPVPDGAVDSEGGHCD
ncbi:hypothetical protein IP91_00082 [Pseudoduganella lurida]|uniref:Uncharacterized protein n=1 Tax=Pseudoduganella lurida TaxID=1036180 RepID=A0A562RIW0_9BURK|nr:hypothetical protein [Pseudoduganella lurida]TWI69017.1 hypothetical protein IP91_00082 [Pseudoduganella lurida]